MDLPAAPSRRFPLGIYAADYEWRLTYVADSLEDVERLIRETGSAPRAIEDGDLARLDAPIPIPATVGITFKAAPRGEYEPAFARLCAPDPDGFTVGSFLLELSRATAPVVVNGENHIYIEDIVLCEPDSSLRPDEWDSYWNMTPESHAASDSGIPIYGIRCGS